jgi:tetratricopeptide (TPR) repeat protein
LVRERAARREAEAARNLARAESARNEQVVKFLMTTIGPGVWSGKEAKLVRPILLDFFAAPLGTDLTNRPAAQGDLWLSVANSCAGIGDYTRAVTNCQLAVNAYRLAFGEDHVKIARALSRLGYFQRLDKDLSGSKANALLAVAVARRCGDPEILATCLLDAARSFTESGEPPPEAIPLLREAIRLRRHDVPHLLALFDNTRLLVRALRALAAEGQQEQAMAILQEELKEAPKDAELLKLLRTFNDSPR